MAELPDDLITPKFAYIFKKILEIALRNIKFNFRTHPRTNCKYVSAAIHEHGHERHLLKMYLGIYL